MYQKLSGRESAVLYRQLEQFAAGSISREKAVDNFLRATGVQKSYYNLEATVRLAEDRIKNHTYYYKTVDGVETVVLQRI